MAALRRKGKSAVRKQRRILLKAASGCKDGRRVGHALRRAALGAALGANHAIQFDFEIVHRAGFTGFVFGNTETAIPIGNCCKSTSRSTFSAY